MTITEIINALRCCADSSTGCSECPFVGKCIHTHADLKLAAVDAIQTLCGELATYHAKSIIDEKQIADLQKQVNEFIENETRSTVIKVMSRRIAELEAQLSKEGEWIVEEIDDSGFKWCKWRCSVCREVIKKGWQHTKDGEKPKWKYCPNCSARMKESKLMINIKWDYQQPSSTTINVASQSATKNVGTHFLCRSTGKLCPNATEYGYCKQTVCTIDLAQR